MKKNIIMIVVIILIVVLGVFTTYSLLQSNKENNNGNNVDNNSNGNSNNNNNNSSNSNDKKILVVYYSAQSHTENVAKKIADNLNADIFEIEPVDEYTSSDLDWTNSNSRVSREHDDESLRDVKLKTSKIENLDDYDTILIGYPIWWGIAAWPVNNFVKDNDFTNKTVIPFCTSSSSGMGNSDKLLENIASGGNWLSGQRFSSNPSNDDIKRFTDSL